MCGNSNGITPFPRLALVLLLASFLATGCGESSSSSESDDAASSRSSSTDEDTTSTTSSDDALATDQDVTAGPLEDSSADQTDGPGPGPAGQGACINGDDHAALDDMKNWDDDWFVICGDTCFGDDDDVTECATDCFVGLMETSEECSACFGGIVVCQTENCPEECPNDDACICCVSDAGCFDDFQDCAGMPLLEGDYGACTNPEDVGEEGACINQEDEKVLEESESDFLGNCGAQCSNSDDLESCIADCLLTTSGLSEDCAECYSDLYLCISTACSEDCSMEPGDDLESFQASCDACVETECVIPFAECTGLGVKTDQSDDPESEMDGPCTNSSDMALMDLADANSYEVCFDACAEAEDFADCLQNCLETEEGWSSACSECHAENIVCSIEKCDVCTDEGVSEEQDDLCDVCRDEKCLPDFLICAGFVEDDSSCDDGEQNGDEEGVDCGGSCDACVVVVTCDGYVAEVAEVTQVMGLCSDDGTTACAAAEDCASADANCDGYVAAVAAVAEVMGACADDASACATAADCDEVAATCDDGVMNGDETDVDCGGSCETACE